MEKRDVDLLWTGLAITGAGHLSALERPEEFAAAVGGFLARRLGTA